MSSSVFGIGRGVWGVGVGVLVVGCVVLGSGAVSATAATGQLADSALATPVVGSFDLGYGVDGQIDERVGSLSFVLPRAGLELRWDSRALGLDMVGLGAGWILSGVPYVGVDGGVKVFPVSGGDYDADASAPSGMAGYVLGDAVFSQTGGVVPARTDGMVAEREYAFELSQTGGTTTYFNADGEPLTQIKDSENRTDWVPASDGSHRLMRVVDPVGVVTGVDWSNPSAVHVTRATATPPGAASVGGEVELDGGRVAGVVDAVGGRVSVDYDSSGLIARITGVSGAVTDVSWQPLVDGSAGVDRVRVIDGLTGAVLSVREWDAESGVASGWPMYAGEGDVFSSGDGAFRYRTALSDGATRVISEYNSTHLLIGRSVEVTTESGPVVIQEQAFRYPGTDGGTVPDPWDLPAQFNRPTAAEVTYRDDAGRERTTSDAYEFDPHGHMVSHTSPDGTVTETVYDETVLAGGVLPVGLPLSETVRTTDGLVSQTRYELNPTRTAPVVEESLAGKAGEVLTRTGRTERAVRTDGFVSEERVFGQGGTGTPVVTTHARDVDLAASTQKITDTAAAGTDLAVTTSHVSDLLTEQTISETDALGNTTTSSYDPSGRVTARTDTAGNLTRTRYLTVQADGVNATVVTAPDGVVTTTETDVLGRVVKVTDNLKDGAPVDGHVRVVESRIYPDPGTVEVTDAWGAVTVTKQDVFGRERETVASNGLAKITQYDDIAHTVTTGLTPTGNISDAEYVRTSVLDEVGQVTRSSGVRADQKPVPTTASVFNGFGRETSTSDETTVASTKLDVFGNPTSTTLARHDSDGVPIVAERRFDQFGTSVEKTLSAGAESRSGGTRTLDILGRVLSETDQVGSTTTYTHTPDGHVAKALTGYGRSTVNTYDPLTRKLTETVTTSPIGDDVRSGYEYDPVTGNLLAVFDPADRAGTQVSYTYDGFKNTTSTTYPDGKQITHTYDDNGRKTSTTDTAGNTTSYAHDPAGLLTAAVQVSPDGTEIGRVAYTYDEYGRTRELSRGNGVTTRYTFTSLDEIATETTTGSDGSIQDARSYTYDGRGNLTRRIDTTSDLADGGDPTTTTTTYEYDEQDRLTHSTVHRGDTVDGSMVKETTYVMTVSGDISRETVTAPNPGTGVDATTVREFTYTPTGEIAGITTTAADGTRSHAAPTYDAAGNLTTAVDGTAYSYNAVNRPVTETSSSGETVSTGYWATGQRAHLIAAGPGDESARASFYWDDSTLINDTHSEGENSTGTASYLIGTARQSRTTTGPESRAAVGADTVYYTQDRHGNTTALTAADGTPTTRYTYADYGTTTRTGGGADTGAAWIGELSYQPFQYAGEHTTPAGEQYLQARMFDPATMRFTTQDTAELHNTYNYADLNPVTKTDPTGHIALGDAIGVVVLGALALVGAIVSATATVTGLLAVLTMEGGLAAVGMSPVVAAIVGIGANLYSAALSAGLIVTTLAPDLDANATAFFNSSFAWISQVVALAVGAAASALLKVMTAQPTLIIREARESASIVRAGAATQTGRAGTTGSINAGSTATTASESTRLVTAPQTSTSWTAATFLSKFQ
ncbi:RHS repeat protein [Microbacterium rhizomatis]|uniref:RHS repeat protein n=1 Tax=Microbacterium rhizomatis TaxID=1631477 RepID=A0A5J5J426_9MICO|nr:RHS repeat-associated core domain-containing protein [Microbacterium rhizomatis]KAA9110826.1 RHS repeat protein [Microbacterium rhizomatis]